MRIEPYLFFEGRCEEAIEFYRRAVGAQVGMMLRWKDRPDPSNDRNPTPPGGENKIMHARFQIGGAGVMASDGRCTGSPNFQGFAISLNAANEAEAARLFNGFSEGGQIRMPLGRTFFARSFGMVTDRFGVSWMIAVM
jgi:PhnB protein